MDKGNYKSSRSSEYTEGAHIEPLYFDGVSNTFLDDGLTHTFTIGGSAPISAPTLTELLTYEPNDADYDYVLDLLVELCQKTYNNFSFMLAKSSDETKMPNFMQVTSPHSDFTDLHKRIFQSGVKYNLDMRTLQEKFAKRAADGRVLALGEDVVIIIDDGTPQLPTGVSPIQSGLENSEITYIFSFLKKENFEEWKKNTFPKDEKDGE